MGQTQSEQSADVHLTQEDEAEEGSQVLAALRRLERESERTKNTLLEVIEQGRREVESLTLALEESGRTEASLFALIERERSEVARLAALVGEMRELNKVNYVYPEKARPLSELREIADERARKRVPSEVIVAVLRLEKGEAIVRRFRDVRNELHSATSGAGTHWGRRGLASGVRTVNALVASETSDERALVWYDGSSPIYMGDGEKEPVDAGRSTFVYERDLPRYPPSIAYEPVEALDGSGRLGMRVNADMVRY